MQGRTVKEVVKELSYEQLVKLEHDIASGAHHLGVLVKERKKQLEIAPSGICASCGSPLHPSQSSVYTLLFGPTDMRKKASFCGLDCLDEFEQKLRVVNARNNHV